MGRRRGGVLSFALCLLFSSALFSALCVFFLAFIFFGPPTAAVGVLVTLSFWKCGKFREVSLGVGAVAVAVAALIYLWRGHFVRSFFPRFNFSLSPPTSFPLPLSLPYYFIISLPSRPTSSTYPSPSPIPSLHPLPPSDAIEKGASPQSVAQAALKKVRVGIFIYLFVCVWGGMSSRKMKE